MGRDRHIVPVLLDDTALQGALGISSTVGRIDLREQWTAIRATGVISADERNTIRNRCVLPMLEKLDDHGTGEP